MSAPFLPPKIAPRPAPAAVDPPSPMPSNLRRFCGRADLWRAQRLGIAGRMSCLQTITARILIVEDDQDIAELVARYLDKAGFITEHATSGKEALQAIAARP